MDPVNKPQISVDDFDFLGLQIMIAQYGDKSLYLWAAPLLTDAYYVVEWGRAREEFPFLGRGFLNAIEKYNEV